MTRNLNWAMRSIRVAALVLICLGAAGLVRTQTVVPTEDEKFPKIRFSDGQVSVNDRCPVRLKPLNPEMNPIYVNGSPVGFC